jgi:hypothetical protein
MIKIELLSGKGSKNKGLTRDDTALQKAVGVQKLRIHLAPDR